MTTGQPTEAQGTAVLTVCAPAGDTAIREALAGLDGRPTNATAGLRLEVAFLDPGGWESGERIAEAPGRVLCLEPSLALGELARAGPARSRVIAEFDPVSDPGTGASARAAATEAIGAIALGQRDERTRVDAEAFSAGEGDGGGCRVVAEVRSLDEERTGETVAGIVDSFTWAASECGCDVDFEVAELAAGYSVPAGSAALALARATLGRLDLEPREVAPLGGSGPVGGLRARGVDAVALGVGGLVPGRRLGDAILGALEEERC